MVERELPHKPTPDVSSTIDWLANNGFTLVASRGPEGMGFQLLEYENAGTRVRLLTDRDEWMADIQQPSWGCYIGLDTIVDAIDGRTRWDADGWSHDRLPQQLPPGVSWRKALPAALAWTANSPDALASLERFQQERAKQLFHP